MTWPTLEQVFAGFACKDCLASVAVTWSPGHHPLVRVLHDWSCPAIPDPSRRLFFTPLPLSYTVELSTQEEQ